MKGAVSELLQGVLANGLSPILPRVVEVDGDLPWIRIGAFIWGMKSKGWFLVRPVPCGAGRDDNLEVIQLDDSVKGILSSPEDGSRVCLPENRIFISNAQVVRIREVWLPEGIEPDLAGMIGWVFVCDNGEECWLICDDFSVGRRFLLRHPKLGGASDSYLGSLVLRDLPE